MKSKAKVRVGLIGCGSRMRFVMQPTSEIEVVALCDPHPESIAAAKKQYGESLMVYEDYLEMVADPTIDWICVGSWNSKHREHALAALDANKHVFCEKPLATNLDDCLALRDAARRSSKLFFFGLVLRFSPLYAKVKEILASEIIGQPVSFEFNETLDVFHGGYIMGGWRRYRKNAGSHILEKCCHDLDLANWMVGSLPERAASFGGLDYFLSSNQDRKQQIEDRDNDTWKGVELEDPFLSQKDIVDNQVVILEYRNGVRATFHTNCNAGIPERRFYICGTDGSLRADARTGVVEWQQSGRNTVLNCWKTEVSGSHAGADEFMRTSLFESMLVGKQPPVGIDEALKSAISSFGIDDALDTGNVVSLAPLWNKATL